MPLTDPAGAPLPPPRVVVMGVSGCGKSTVGPLIAAAFGVAFLEGDTLHPPENVARMAAGTPLTDADRAGWLDVIAGRIGQAHDSGIVVSCSALKRAYRDRLRRAAPELAFIHLAGTREAIAARLAERRGHYMPPALLASQFEALEPPAADERAFTLDVGRPPTELAAAAIAWLREETR